MTDLRRTIEWIRAAIAARGAHDPTLLADIDERCYHALNPAPGLDVQVDESLPDNVAEFRYGKRVVGRIEDLAP